MNVLDWCRSASLIAVVVLVSTVRTSAQDCGSVEAGDCCVANGSPACDDLDCCAIVCAGDPFCCEADWDDVCARQASELCGDLCPPSQCPLPCPPGALHEDELCGGDTNGGCNADPPVYTLAACGLTFCGTAWADGGTRDTDWYLIDLPDPDGDGSETISATLTSQFPGSCVIADVGGGDCSVLQLVGSIGCGDNCLNISIASATLPAPATYAVFVATGLCDFSDILDGYPCGGGNNNYVLQIDCAATCDLDAAVANLDVAIPIQAGIVVGFESAGANFDAADVELIDADAELALVEGQLDAAVGLLLSADGQLASADTDLASTEGQIQTAQPLVTNAIGQAGDAATAADQAAFHYDQVGQLALACGPCADPIGTEIGRILVKLGGTVSQLLTAQQQETEAQTQLIDAFVQSTEGRAQAQQARDQYDEARQQAAQANLQTTAARPQQQQAKSLLNRAGIKNNQAITQATTATTLANQARAQVLALPPNIIRAGAKLISSRIQLNRAKAKGAASTAQTVPAAALIQRADVKEERAAQETTRAEQKTIRAKSQNDRSTTKTERAVAQLERSDQKLDRARTDNARAADKFLSVFTQSLVVFDILTICGPCADAALTELGLAEDQLAVGSASVERAILDLDVALVNVGGAITDAGAAATDLAGASADADGVLPELNNAIVNLGDARLNAGAAIGNANGAISDIQGATGDIDVVDPILLDTISILSACPPCPWDLDIDGLVGITDFLALLAAWGPNPGHPADFDGDGEVGIVDFLKLLAMWGPCPGP